MTMDMKLTDDQARKLDRAAASFARLVEKIATEITNDLSRSTMAENFGPDWTIDPLFVIAGKAVHDEAQALVARRIAETVAGKLTAARQTALN